MRALKELRDFLTAFSIAVLSGLTVLILAILLVFAGLKVQ